MSDPITIRQVKAREILDSRGVPTIEVELFGECSRSGPIQAGAMVPSGASTGEFEAIELRDDDPKRYFGKGVLRAVDNVRNKIAPVIVGQSFARQTLLDDLLRDLDGTKNKSNLGANALLAVSLAYSRLAANAEKVPLYRSLSELTGTRGVTLPTPLMNVINGGAHADNSLSVQEFMIVPAGFPNFRDALRAGSEIFHQLKRILKTQSLSTAVGDEGGFAPHFDEVDPHDQALSALVRAIQEAGYHPGKDVFIALDAAASEFVKKESIKGEDCIYDFEGAIRSSEEMIETYQRWVNTYPIVSIEDGLSEHDWSGWKQLTEKLGKQCQLVGDDLFVTNPEFLKKGIDQSIGNSILIKVNQIGTLTETLETMKMAAQAGYTSVVSHRSGETEDTYIADLAVGTDCGMIKTGSLSRTDRIAKYNRLLKIEEELGDKAVFAGKKGIKNLQT